MSPIRKSEDYRATEINSWEEYIQEEEAGMEARGELKNLPGAGKPIKIWKTELNPENDLAFSRLKNAGIKPVWMELDQEIGRRTDELWTRLDSIERSIRSLLEQMRAPKVEEPEEHVQPGLWQRFIGWFRSDFHQEDAPAPTLTSIMAERDRERSRFLDIAAELDKKISEYHNSLPTGAEHLQRVRWLPERAARVFDERITLADWWEEERAGHA